MNLISFDFLLLVMLAAPLLRFITSSRLRPIVLFGINILFIASFWGSIGDALPVLGMVALSYLCVCVVARSRSRLTFGLLVALLVAVFVWLKQYAFLTVLLPQVTTPFMVVGLSYILFRVLHVLIDVAQRALPVPSPLAYINYCLFFLSFVSGPIQRFEDFDAQVRQPASPLTVPVLHKALGRVVLGIFLIVGLSALCEGPQGTLIQFFTSRSPVIEKWWVTMPLFSIISMLELSKLYFNFAGSMHMVVGLGVLAGIQLPENFNRPYLAKNFLDFWARWHITLSQWIKYYLFNPLLGFLVRRFPSARGAYYAAPVAFFVAFVVIGVWHGSTWLFLFFGLMLGVGATANTLWQQLLTRRLGKKRYLALSAHGWYAHGARGLTLAYIAVALVCLWLAPSTIRAMGITWFASVFVVGFAILSVVFTVLSVVLTNVALLLSRIPLRLPKSERLMPYSMALMVWFVINLLGAFGRSAPEFIYKTF